MPAQRPQAEPAGGADELLEPDDELPPASYVLAGYIKEGDTPAADLARRLMGDQDWERASDLVYPQLVLVLFTADVVRERATATAGHGARRSGHTVLLLHCRHQRAMTLGLHLLLASPKCWPRARSLSG